MLLLVMLSSSVEAVPYFARKYNLTCGSCHTLPPSLNEFGLNFVANGYTLKAVPAHPTWPLAVWATHRIERHDSQRRKFTKAFPNRVEVVSGGKLSSRTSYFLEWRPLSFEATGQEGRLLDRSGRFEDLFLNFDISDQVSVMIGQFRMLSQWDVSRRLSLSTPVGFAASVPGKPASKQRLSSLRSFSLEGRAPAVRFSLGDPAADGWNHEVTVPFGGELSLPLTRDARDAASFELEARPKGAFLETSRRRGLDSFGGSLFLGDDRWMAALIGQKQVGATHLYGAAGTARFRSGVQDFRMSLGHYWIPRTWFAWGSRLDHRSTDGLGVAFVPHVNVHFPGSKYTFLFVLEPFLQKDNSGVAAEISAIF